MPDISITPANVLFVSGGKAEGIAGASITAGQVVYLDSATNTYKLAICSGTGDQIIVRGIALHASAANQPLQIQTSGIITIGGTVLVGRLYVLSAVAGNIDLSSDLVSTNKVCFIGFGTSATQITLDIQNTGVVYA